MANPGKEEKNNLEKDASLEWAEKIVRAFNKCGQSQKFNFPTSCIIAGDMAPDKSEEPARVADFLIVDDTFKVLEMAVKNMPKKEALKDKNEHIMNACFGPELAKKVRKEHSGTGNCRPKGQPKSGTVGDDGLEMEVLACINDIASP